MNPRFRPPLALLLLLLAVPAAANPADVHTLYQQATTAYKQKDYATYYARITRLGEMFPNDSEMIFRRAGASALTGRTADAERLLRSLTVRQAWFDVAGSPDFATIRNSAAYRDTVAAMVALKAGRIGSASVAFRLLQKDFIPEAIAWDPGTRSFLLSSVHHRKIVRVEKNGAARDLVPEASHGLGSPLGLAV